MAQYSEVRSASLTNAAEDDAIAFQQPGIPLHFVKIAYISLPSLRCGDKLKTHVL
jgi:hypothetical protein